MSGRNGKPEQRPGQDDDDDFGEFGGFEAADPMESMGAAGGQAAAVPWAALASASAGARAQPDLLCPQNTFPPCLDPSGISGSPLHAGAINSNADASRPDGVPPLFDAHFNGELQQQDGAVAEQHENAAPLADVLDGTFDSSAAHSRAGGASFAANGMLPDIGLGTNQNPLFAERPLGVDVSQNAHALEEVAPAPAADEPVVFEANLDNAEPRQAEVAARAVDEEDRERQATAPDAEAVVDEAEHNRLQRELASLQSSNLILSQELERSQTVLASQRLRLQEVQQEHAEQLEAVRQSGHEALAVVMEQYKELSRTAVLEQQEASQRHLVEVMEQQLQHFQTALQGQRDEWERERREATTQMQQELAAALETLRTEQQEKFNAHLLEERRKQEETIKEAVEAERSRCQQQMQEAIAAEESKAAEHLKQTKEEYDQQLEEQRRRFEEMLREQCKVEREQAQERLSSCLDDERQRGREMTERALQEARAERDSYVQQQRQSDSTMRRRQLASLDLFLESSRRQVDMLLNAETPQPDASPTLRPPPDEGSKNS